MYEFMSRYHSNHRNKLSNADLALLALVQHKNWESLDGAAFKLWACHFIPSSFSCSKTEDQEAE